MPLDQKSFYTHSIKFLGDVGHVESHFGPFSDSVDLDARYVHGLRRTYHRLTNCFGSTGWNSNLISVLLETVLV
jgi:hypothetical protein